MNAPTELVVIGWNDKLFHCHLCIGVLVKQACEDNRRPQELEVKVISVYNLLFDHLAGTMPSPKIFCAFCFEIFKTVTLFGSPQCNPGPHIPQISDAGDLKLDRMADRCRVNFLQELINILFPNLANSRSLILKPSTDGMTIGTGKRSYRACLRCRRRKAKCNL